MIGSVFTGYGGLEMAVGGRVAWVADNDPAAAAVLAHHLPDVPNLGDVTVVDWAGVDAVDVLTGGFPCQDVSAAGKRAGLIRHGNRSGLWAVMSDAIEALRPRLVVIENVRGLLSAKTSAHPALLACPACLDAHHGDPSYGMRALGAVLGDLAELGYDAGWQVVRASDVGAPHQRARVIVIAWPADTDRSGLAKWCEQPARPADGGLLGSTGPAAQRGGSDAAQVTMLPTPTATSYGTNRGGAAGRTGPVRASLETIARGGLLPTPRTHTGGGGGSDTKRATRPGAGGPTLADAILLPTPRATDGTKGGPNQRGSSGDETLPSAVQAGRWGKYADAVHRWEQLTRPAPDPTEVGPRGGHRLAPAFVEWMMGLPPGHVTGVRGLTRNQQLRLLGNGVVPAQAAHGLALLLDSVAAA